MPNDTTGSVLADLGLASTRVEALRASVLLAALSDLGASEDPPGSNEGPQIAHLVRGIADYWFSDLKHPDWCAASVSQWVRRGLGLPNWRLTRTKPFAPSVAGHPWGKFYVGVKQIYEWACDVEDEHPGVWLQRPEPGAVFIIASHRDGRTIYEHTGLVLSVDGDHVVTVEGNMNQKVCSRRLRTGYPAYYIAWWAVL